MYNSISIKGAKKKPKQARKPVIAKDSASSISFFKGHYGTTEGEAYGLVNGGKSIFLEGTPVLDDDGNPNFEGVTWEERKGTLNQEYMQGFPDVSNETGIGVELKGGTPWVRSITNTQLSALRLRFKWDRLSKTNPDNGDVTGYRIDYAIDLRTDGGAYQEVLSTKIEDKTSAGYERTHRIDLPKSKTGWSVRVRRITPNANSEYIADRMYVDALAEVIDVKLAYPYTAGIGLQYNAETFNGVAKVEFLKRGRILKVPTNYNAETRQYTGIWDGTFKEAYSNNPAWVYYDLLTNKRYGLGHRLDASMIDKWGIYNLARYCDDMVSDGQGGLEPRFTCNVYLQKQATAYEVLQHIAGIFSALSYWNGEKIFLDADVPRDPVFTFTNANVVGGGFNYSGTRDRDRHNIIKVAWDNPANGFKTEYEYVRDERSIALNGIKPLDLAAFGCTSQSQAQRLGLRALKTEQLETQQVTFSTGLAAINCKVGDVIAISDASLAGKSNGGLISNVAGNVITIDRDAVINIGDTLTVNTAKGLSERRNVTAVSGRNITVAAAFDGAEREHVWSVESSDLKMQLFRVMSVTENDDATYSVLGIQHEPQKFNAIDFGTDVKLTSISIVDDIAITPPESVVIKSRHRVEQGQTVATLIIEWSQVKEAVAYEVEWRKDDGSWVRVPRTGTNSVEIDGVYAGQYLARVRSVGAFDSVSNATTSMLTEVKGKVGKPPKLANLKATGILFGMELSWSFAQGSKDADYVEIEQGSAPDTNVSLLGQFSYPTDRHEITGLQGGLTRSYRARLVDKLGFKSDWTAWATATVDDSADKVLDLIEGQITESHLYQELTDKINLVDKIEPIDQRITQEIEDRIKALGEIKDGYDQKFISVDNSISNAQSKADKASEDIIRVEGTVSTLKESVEGNTGLIVEEKEIRVQRDAVVTQKLDYLSSEIDMGYADKTQYANQNRSIQWTLATAISAENYTQNQKIENLQSEFQGSTSQIQKELLTLASKDLSIASEQTRLSAKVGEHSADILDLKLAVKDPETGLAAKYSQLSTQMGTVTQQVGTFDNKFGNISGQITTIQNTVNGQKNAIEVVASLGDADKLKYEIAKARLNKDKPILQGKVADLDSLIAKYKAQRTDAQAKKAQATDADVIASYDAQIALLNTSITDAETQRSEVASQVTQLDQEIKELASLKLTESNIKKQYFVKFDSGNRAAGFGIMENADATIDFAVLADKFYIAPPSGTGKGIRPFAVYTSPTTINGVTVPAGTYMDNAFIANGTLDAAKIKDATITTAKIDNAAITSAKIDDLAVTSGKIANLAVDTLQIANNAVTVPRYIYIADEKVSDRPAEMTGPYYPIAQLSLGSFTYDAQDSAAVSLFVSIDYIKAGRLAGGGGNWWVKVHLKKNGSVMHTWTRSGKAGGNTYTYEDFWLNLPPYIDVNPKTGGTISLEIECYSSLHSDSVNVPGYPTITARGVTFGMVGAKR